mgnify:CR=1 FL=1
MLPTPPLTRSPARPASRTTQAEDNAALEKYRHADDGKVKELTLALERVSKQVVGRKEELEAEVVETQAAQIQLDKAAEDFRKLHVERQDLIRQVGA